MRRYTSALYAALDAGSLRPAQRARLAVASALFGLLGADDPYRPTGCPPRRPFLGWARCDQSGVRHWPHC
jgi:hypothetical protein